MFDSLQSSDWHCFYNSRKKHQSYESHIISLFLVSSHNLYSGSSQSQVKVNAIISKTCRCSIIQCIMCERLSVMNILALQDSDDESDEVSQMSAPRMFLVFKRKFSYYISNCVKSSYFISNHVVLLRHILNCVQFPHYVLIVIKCNHSHHISALKIIIASKSLWGVYAASPNIWNTLDKLNLIKLFVMMFMFIKL